MLSPDPMTRVRRELCIDGVFPSFPLSIQAVVDEAVLGRQGRALVVVLHICRKKENMQEK
jgi:hypothetical protein